MQVLALTILPDAATTTKPASWPVPELARRTGLSPLKEASPRTATAIGLAPVVPGAPVPRAVTSLPSQASYSIRGADLRGREVMLPFGLAAATTRITAGMLKRLAGADRGEQLLKKVGVAWLFVANHEPIDLTDESVEYRLGRLSILS
jgi:hypothetical protein